jgi:hypothetical protein
MNESMPNNKGIRSARFLETSQGGIHPNWSQMLAIKNALAFLKE